LLEDGANALLAARRQLLHELCEQATDAELLARRVEIGRVHFSAQLQAFSVDRAVAVRRHTKCVSAEGFARLRDAPGLPIDATCVCGSAQRRASAGPSS